MSFPRYPKYKDSGVEWLGEVPEHWHHVRVKNLFEIGRGRVISLENASEHGTYPVFSSQTTNNGCLGYIETFDFDCDQLTWTTDGANAGTVFLRRGKHNCTNVCGTLQIKNAAEFNLTFGLHYLSFAAQFYKRPDTNGAKIMNGEMAEIVTLVPPSTEQTRIVGTIPTRGRQTRSGTFRRVAGRFRNGRTCGSLAVRRGRFWTSAPCLSLAVQP